MTKPKQPIFPQVLPDDDEDAHVLDVTAGSGLLALRRFYVAVNLFEADGKEQICSLSPHYASRLRAGVDLAAWRAVFPSAGVVSVVLAFDATDAEHMERYERLRSEAENGPAGKLQ